MTVYFIRHAQSAFNAVHDPRKPDPMIFDAPITELGKTQAQKARRRVKKLNIETVIVSPFTQGHYKLLLGFLDISFRFRLVRMSENNFVIAVMLGARQPNFR